MKTRCKRDEMMSFKRKRKKHEVEIEFFIKLIYFPICCSFRKQFKLCIWLYSILEKGYMSFCGLSILLHYKFHTCISIKYSGSCLNSVKLDLNKKLKDFPVLAR